MTPATYQRMRDDLATLSPDGAFELWHEARRRGDAELADACVEHVAHSVETTRDEAVLLRIGERMRELVPEDPRMRPPHSRGLSWSLGTTQQPTSHRGVDFPRVCVHHRESEGRGGAKRWVWWVLRAVPGPWPRVQPVISTDERREVWHVLLEGADGRPEGIGETLWEAWRDARDAAVDRILDEK